MRREIFIKLIFKFFNGITSLEKNKMKDTICIIQQEEEEYYFDSREEASSMYDSCLSSPASNHDLHYSDNSSNWVYNDPNYEVWINNPTSIEERRSRFMKWIGLDVNEDRYQQNGNDISSDDGPMLISSSSENSTSTSSWFQDEPSTSGDGNVDDGFMFRIKNLDDGSVYVIDPNNDGDLKCLREIGSNRSINLDEFNRTFGASSFVQKLLQREEENRLNNSKKMSRSKTNKWLKKLGAVTCITGVQRLEIDSPNSEKTFSSTTHRIKVRANKKKTKEFSSVYKGQDVKAHDGAILTMKFSPDGKYLASAGEDGVVRVWEVIESERTDESIVIGNDPSCVYLKVDHNSELTPYFLSKENCSLTSMKKNSKSACVVVPPEAFRIVEKPLHEFFGHEGDVLDLSWSNNKHLLSSSVDKTVRLWKVGCAECQNVFIHNNYVTCVQFNPTDENYFVSGSIDGKVRIWNVEKHCVVDWIDIRDIVTASCYSLDGKKIVIGSMTGTCRFYDASDHQLQFDAELCLQPKKKSRDHRITGLQYCPNDHQKLLVTSGDSRIHVLDGLNAISKYKGLRNTGSQISASFTYDGKHIVSASEDSKVYIWNHTNNDPHLQNDVKSNRSYERFFSNHVSVAIPWNCPSPSNSKALTSNSVRNNSNTVYLSPTGSFSFTANHDQVLPENLPKGTATWPEENLPKTPCKSQFKFQNTSCSNSPHAWGHVIVTAGWDGRIRSFCNYGLPVNQ